MLIDTVNMFLKIISYYDGTQRELKDQCCFSCLLNLSTYVKANQKKKTKFFEQGRKNQSVEMRNGYHQAVNVHILCVQVNYATSEELVKG